MDVLGDPTLTRRLLADLTLPMIVAPMYLVSGPDLVIATCRTGVIGSMPALNARRSDEFEEAVVRIKGELEGVEAAAPFAVNLIVHSTNRRLPDDVELCVKHRVPVIIASVGSPRSVVDRIHSYGGLVFCDAASLKHARRAAESGVDGLILLCAGAGGNTGWLSPFAFVSEVRRFFAGPIVIAGAISRGAHLHAAEVMGADMAIVGTSFIAARESLAVDDYRDMLIGSGADDIVLTSEVTGIPSNMLRASLERSQYRANKELKGFDFDHELETLTAWRDIWSAGHGVGDVESVEPAADIVARFRRDYASSRTAGAQAA